MAFFNRKRANRLALKNKAAFLFPRTIHLILAGGCLIILLVLASLAAWLGVPAWYIRLTGTQTTGTARIVADCGADDYAIQGDNAETYQYVFQITDTRGQNQRLTSHSACNNLYDTNEVITIWYLPNDLNSFVTSAEAFWLYALTPIWAIITALMLRFLWLLIRPFVYLYLTRASAAA